MTDSRTLPTCFLCGIGGSGMSALAQLLLARGWAVAGSDRSHDRGETPEKFKALAARGIALFPQDGSGVQPPVSLLVVSSAVEETVPDVKAARTHDIPIRKRADMLAEQFNDSLLSIGVAGTSGKSTVTAMTGWVLEHAGRQPTIINGALMGNFEGADGGANNAVIGDPGHFVAEIDESDGSIVLFRPRIGIITNISLDHKPLEELRALFSIYINQSGTIVINADDAETQALVADDQSLLADGKTVVTVSLADKTATLYAADITPLNEGVAFTVVQGGERIPVTLKLPGRHNVMNALMAMAAASGAGVPLAEGARALEAFKGVRRRFEYLGQEAGITVIDDFAHNPDKIAATLQAAHEKQGRLWVVFQPHGFRPTQLMHADLVASLCTHLAATDTLLMPEIFYAGGTAQKVISSADIVEDVRSAGKNAVFIEKRDDIIPYLRENARAGDRIIVMGARDDTLPAFGRAILASFLA